MLSSGGQSLLLFSQVGAVFMAVYQFMVAMPDESVTGTQLSCKPVNKGKAGILSARRACIQAYPVHLVEMMSMLHSNKPIPGRA